MESVVDAWKRQTIKSESGNPTFDGSLEARMIWTVGFSAGVNLSMQRCIEVAPEQLPDAFVALSKEALDYAIDTKEAIDAVRSIDTKNGPRSLGELIDARVKWLRSELALYSWWKPKK